MTTLTTAPLAPLLEQLFAKAESTERTAELEAIPVEERMAMIRSTTRYREFYSMASTAYMAVSRATGRLLYLLTRTTCARSIVEFGTSFGISTLHLAAGLRDNGGGRIVTSEFEPSKAAAARQNFTAAGLDDLIELREGEALQTLASGLPQQIDLVLLDGAKGLYPDVLTLLEEYLRPGAILLADNAEWSAEYLERVRSGDAYLSVPVGEDVEVSMRLG